MTSPSAPSLLITGATRGLGFAAARAAAARGARVIVAGRDERAVRALADELGGAPLVLDLASLASTRAAVEAVGPVDVAVANAGLQSTGPARRMTADGYETTFQVNHLAHLMLLDGLLACDAPPARIVTLGSSTHDPSSWTGMPAPMDGDLRAIAVGGEDDARAGQRRYSTSKLLTTVTALGLARERPDVHVTCFDPGAMLGTGLFRGYPGWGDAGWQRAVGRASGRLLGVLPSFSTPERSGAALARLALDEPPVAASGSVVDFRLRPGAGSARAADPAFQDEVLRASRELLDGARRSAPARE